jgi:ABC-type multidrug transport system ATPase subunit
MLFFEHVTFCYKSQVKAVNDVSIHVDKGQILGLLGHNGAGKTTTLRLVLGLLKPQSGNVKVGGYELWNATVPRTLMAYMPETNGIYERLTGFQNLEFRARTTGMDINKIKAKSEMWLDGLGILDRGNEKAGTWSKGLKQRLSLACALICEPSLLLLDEPTNGLDPESLSVVLDILRDLRERGTTIIMSSHDLNTVTAICSHISILQKGKAIYMNALEGTFESLQNTYLKLTKDGAH